MPLWPRDLSGRHRSGAGVDLSLHGLSDAYRLALPGDGDLLGRANPDDGSGRENLRQDGRQRPDTLSALLRRMRFPAFYERRGWRPRRLGYSLGQHSSARPAQADAADMVPVRGTLDQRPRRAAWPAWRLRDRLAPKGSPRLNTQVWAASSAG